MFFFFRYGKYCFYLYYLTHCFCSLLKTPFKYREHLILSSLNIFHFANSLTLLLSFYFVSCCFPFDPFWVFTWFFVILAYSSFIGVKFLVSLFCSLFLWCGNSALFWGAGQAVEIVSHGVEETTSCLGLYNFSEFICCESLWRPPYGQFHICLFLASSSLQGAQFWLPTFYTWGEALSSNAVGCWKRVLKSHVQFCAPVYQ